MKKPFLSFIILLLATVANAQFYYKDIVSNKQLLADMAAYKQANVRVIAIKSFEDNGIESESFFCTKKLSKDYKRTELFTRADMAPASLFVSIFDKEGKLISTNDSSSIVVTKIRYAYDDKKRLASITSTIRSKDDDFDNSITEEHIYTYENDLPKQMLRIKNNIDTTIIYFSADEKGNIGIEKDGKTGSKYFYYYDAKNNLTDIVQATETTKKLKPDYVFEYNSAAQITQMTTVEAGSNNYFIWKYSYNDGLRVKERCFTNEKRLMGSVEYEYK